MGSVSAKIATKRKTKLGIKLPRVQWTGIWKIIAEEIDKHQYMSGVARDKDRVKSTGEVFTPTDLVIEMMQKMDIDAFAPGKTVLDPACGDGQFLVAAKMIKILYHNMSEEEALKDIYGVDIKRDNVDICKTRLGGGNIIMGNTLSPLTRLEQQTLNEYILMVQRFGMSKIKEIKHRAAAKDGRSSLDRLMSNPDVDIEGSEDGSWIIQDPITKELCYYNTQASAFMI